MSAADFPPATRVETLNIAASQLAAVDLMVLNADGRLRMLPAAFWRGVPFDLFRGWCARRARYGIPTDELCLWLDQMIGGRRALEIGAGCGDLGRMLGIPMTDSYQQQDNKATVAYLRQYGQEPTAPPPDVEKEDAENAVRRRKPQVVIGSWITQKHDGVSQAGNMFGPREDYILERCETYIHIGNENIHRDKRLLKLTHETYHFDWLVSRGFEQAKNVIHVWHNPRPGR